MYVQLVRFSGARGAISGDMQWPKTHDTWLIYTLNVLQLLEGNSEQRYEISD